MSGSPFRREPNPADPAYHDRVAVAPLPAQVTFEEFLAGEDESWPKHEYVGGQVFAMSGGTLRHSQCIGQLVAALLPSVQSMGCRISQGDALLRTTESAYYPDLMITCGPMVSDRFESGPCLVAEVLSPSTMDIDRREKLSAYQAIPTVLTYLLVDHEAEEVTALERTEQGWTRRVLAPGNVLDLQCPAMRLEIAQIFQGLPG